MRRTNLLIVTGILPLILMIFWFSGFGNIHPSTKTQMKDDLKLTITSLLSILFMTFHLSDDIVRGFEPGGFRNVSEGLMMVLWLFGTLVLPGRRSGYIIMLLGSMLGMVVPLAHMRGAGLVGGRIANSGGKFFWVWTLITLQVTAIFSLILSIRGLWSLRMN